MVVRQWQLLELLRERRWTLPRLAAELHVTTRTIRRDIEALEEAHFPITHDEKRHTWHLLDWRRDLAA